MIYSLTRKSQLIGAAFARDFQAAPDDLFKTSDGECPAAETAHEADNFGTPSYW